MKTLLKQSSLNKNKHILIIDGMNLFHRQYHIFNKYPYGTPFGFLNSLMSFNEMVQTNKIIVAWDGDKVWRKEQSADYKKSRDDRFTEDEKENFSRNLHNTKKLLEQLSIIQVLKRDCEADDLIALFTLKYNKDVVIASNDKDFMQLISDKKNIRILRPDKNGGYKVYCEKDVIEHYGVPAAKIAAYLAIAGDVSDGVKGVHKMGDVKARKLINDGVIKTNKLKEVFNAEQLKQFINSYHLVKLGIDKFHHIKVTNDDVTVKKFNGDETNISMILDEYQIKKYKSIQLKCLINNNWIDEFINGLKVGNKI